MSLFLENHTLSLDDSYDFGSLEEALSIAYDVNEEFGQLNESLMKDEYSFMLSEESDQGFFKRTYEKIKEFIENVKLKISHIFQKVTGWIKHKLGMDNEEGEVSVDAQNIAANLASKGEALEAKVISATSNDNVSDQTLNQVSKELADFEKELRSSISDIKEAKDKAVRSLAKPYLVNGRYYN